MRSRLKALITVTTVLALPLSTLSPVLAEAPELGRLEGKVLAAEGDPVQGAVVMVRSLSDRSEHASSPTDTEGAYTLGGLPAGEYAIAVRTGESVYLGARALKVSAMAGQTYSFRIEDRPRAEILSMVQDEGDDQGGEEQGEKEKEKKKKKGAPAGAPALGWVDNPLVVVAAGLVFVIGTGALIEAVDDEDDDEDDDGSPSAP